MEGIFQEFENENALRTYPFAAGCLPTDEARAIRPSVFVDAALYPINPRGVVYLSGISRTGEFVVSDESGIIMSGSQDGNRVELFDTTPFGRHVGTLLAGSADALAELAGKGEDRAYGPDETAFASGCVFPIVLDCVTSVSVGGSDALTGSIAFANKNTDDVRVSSGTTEDGSRTLRFDVVPRPGEKDESSIRRIICVVDGQTPFRIEKLAYNVILVRLEGIDREIICAAAHRESSFEMADTCECNQTGGNGPVHVPETFQIEEVLIPPGDGSGDGVRNGAENAFFLVPANLSGYVNPISVTLEDGTISPNTEGPSVTIDGTTAELTDGALVDTITSKSVVIQVPGLSGGLT